MSKAKPSTTQVARYSALRTGNRQYLGFSPGNWVAPKPGPWRDILLSAVYWPSSTPSGLLSVIASELPNGTLGDLADDVKHIIHQDGVGPRSFGIILLLIERAAADIDVTAEYAFPTEDDAKTFSQYARTRWEAEQRNRKPR